MAAVELPKYLKTQLANKKWPQLLILKDKHSTDYYLLEDQEALGRACLEILKARIDPKYGYIQAPGPESKIYGIKEELTQEAAEALPEPYRKQALQVRKDNDALRREWKEEVERYQMAKSALKDKDGMAAFLVLHARRDYEYEGFDFESPRVP